MGRKTLPKSFTLREDQIDYLRKRCPGSRGVSEWVRSAIDSKIKVETDDAQLIIRAERLKRVRNFRRAQLRKRKVSPHPRVALARKSQE